MDFNDLRVLLIAMFALTFVVMRSDALTGTSTLDKTEPRQSSYSTEQIYDPLVPRSSYYDDSITTRLPESKPANDLLHDDDSANDYTSEFEGEQPSRKESEKKHFQHSKNKWTKRGRTDSGEDELQQCGLTYVKKCCDTHPTDDDCDCRCGMGKVAGGEGGPHACPDGGSFTARPTLYEGGNGDGVEDAAGSEGSTAARITGYLMSLLSVTDSMAFLIGLIACILLILAI